MRFNPQVAGARAGIIDSPETTSMHGRAGKVCPFLGEWLPNLNADSQE
jgi:hypothetical protein